VEAVLLARARDQACAHRRLRHTSPRRARAKQRSLEQRKLVGAAGGGATEIDNDATLPDDRIPLAHRVRDGGARLGAMKQEVPGVGLVAETPARGASSSSDTWCLGGKGAVATNSSMLHQFQHF
jgi:hypothetical protein